MIDRYGYLQQTPNCIDGWILDYMVAPTHLIGANGMRFGADERLYVAQAFGGQISSVDVDSGEIQIVSPADGDIIAPDDLDFDSKGNLYATEVMSARVSVRRPDGAIDVIASDVPVANGIVVNNDRIFMSEFRADGRILELFTDGSTPRVICEGLVAPNALSMGQDGYLYFPLVPLGEVWRVAINGGPAECIATGLKIPTAVKFNANGELVVVDAGDGSITCINIQEGTKQQISRVAYGIDNLAFDKNGQLYVSHFTDGSIDKIASDGSHTTIHGGGMLGPFGLCSPDGQSLMVADGMSIAQITAAGTHRPAMLLEHGFPGYIRSVTSLPDGSLIFANSAGAIMKYAPNSGEEAKNIADGFDCLMGITVDDSGAIYACESGAGNVICIIGKQVDIIASGLSKPTGITCNKNGDIFISEAATGQITHIENGITHVIATGFSEPQGISLHNDTLYVLDRGTHSLSAINLATSATTQLAKNLPVGTVQDIHVNTLPGIADLMPGPLLPFADITVLSNGQICISCDANGSLLTLKAVV